ncbi:hypothetical protein CC79DRAFT_1323826 [Sarocladium strictum]
MSEPFIQLRGGGATPQPQHRQQTPGAPPPPPPAPGQQGGLGISGGGGAMPQGVPPAQPQNMATHIPPPPFHSIPAELRGRSAVQLSDIRSERMTEGDAREILTQFKVIRFEKCQTTNEVDAEGKAIKPTWGKCWTFDENDTEQVEARKAVKILDKEKDKDGKAVTVTQKKALLPAVLKVQLERQQALLQRDDDPRFVYTLVQLENLCRPLEDGKLDKKADGKNESRDKDKDKKKRDKKYEWDKWDTKNITSDKKGRSKLKERIAVRAYYKRSPAADQDSIQLLQQQQAQLQQHQRHQREHVAMMMHHQQQHHQAQMQPPQPQIMQQPPPDLRTGKGADIQIVQLDGKKGKRGPRSVHSSEGSYSDGWSESEGEYHTPQSSIGSNFSAKHRRRRRERRHHKDKAKYYNVPRTIPVAENLYVVTTGPRGATPGTPLSPQPRLPPVDVDRLRSVRYWENEADHDRERREQDTRRRTIEPAYTYHDLNRQRSYPRLSPLETRRERFDDLDYDREYQDSMARLDRIALEEERERDRDRRAEDAAYERFMRDRPRERRVVVTADSYEPDTGRHAPYIRTVEPTYLDQEARAEDYMESRSAGFSPHPFQPRTRRVYYEER